MLKRNTIFGLVLLALVSFGLACGLGEQTDEANKLIDEANAIIKTNNEQIVKSSNLTTELMGSNLSKAEDLEDYKKENKAKFDELVTLSGQIEKNNNEVVAKFEQASKLKLDEKFKQYLIAKVAEFKKRGESDKLTGPLVKSFVETTDVDKISKQLEDYNKKSADLIKESDELMKKADQIAKDNPNTIK